MTVWPTMITPFNDDMEKSVDYNALGELIEWYIANGVDGLFAVCQSSEMFFLTLEEKCAITEFVIRQSNGRVPVVASGHTSDTLDAQVEELLAVADKRPDALVLICNRLAKEGEPEEVALRNLEYIIKKLPGHIKLGVYECPYPYWRGVSEEMLRYMVSTDRFVFLKDTACRSGNMRNKLEIAKGTSLKIYDANSALLPGSIKMGAAGYCGVMANIHPSLYTQMFKHIDRIDTDQHVAELAHFLSMSSVVETRAYPVCAKYYLSLDGLNIKTVTRSKSEDLLTESFREEVRSLHYLTKRYMAAE